METSAFQGFKLWILSLAGLSKDAAHIYVGLLCYFVWVAGCKKSSDTLLALIPTGVVAVLLEVPDLRDDLVTLGHFRCLASAHDIINTLSWPAVMVLLLQCKLWKRE